MKQGEQEVVPREAIADAVSKMMEHGGNGDEVRGKARKMAVMAKAAMADGGTSQNDLNRLIDDLMKERKVNACLEKKNH